MALIGKREIAKHYTKDQLIGRLREMGYVVEDPKRK